MHRFFILFASFLFILAGVQAAPVVLVTGAARGIGLAISKELVCSGYTVYAAIRSLSSGGLLEELQKDFPENLSIITLDVTNQDSVDTAIAGIFARHGCIDILVNNAGILKYGSIENHTIEEAKELFEVNFFGVMRVSQAVLPIMRRQNSGRIIQISSRSGFRPLPSISVYAASKFALVGLSETMAALLEPMNIQVVLIEPGPVHTDLDVLAPYGTALAPEDDCYKEVFEASGLLDPFNPLAQEPEEIALIVKEAIEAEKPLFRYQTTKAIEQQAIARLVDPTGLTSVQEWQPILYPKPK
jgi:NAD(P)-dependent dehydrogenase (short-subunit alcohol dehydrogenase family)